MRPIKLEHKRKTEDSAWKAALLVLLPLLCAGVAVGQSPGQSESQSCLEAARKALGPIAEVAKCGHLTGGDALETVAVVRLKSAPPSCGRALSVSRLEVLREHKPQWDVELTLDEWAHNEVGYLGLDFIDDSHEFKRTFAGHCVDLSDQIDEGKRGFAIVYKLLFRTGEMGFGQVEVAWNPAVGRFQEYMWNDEPPRFRPEIKDPPRLSEYLKLHGCRETEKPPCGK